MPLSAAVLAESQLQRSAAEPDLVSVGIAVRGLAHAVRVRLPFGGSTLRIERFGEAVVSPVLLFAAAIAIQTGPEVGQKIPAFEAQDQNGKTQTLASISGPKGAMLVFYRSADW